MMTESEIAWDLSLIVGRKSLEQVKKMMDEVVGEATALSKKYADRISTMDASEVLEMLQAQEGLQVRASDVVNYGMLKFEACSTDKEATQLNSWAREAQSQLGQTLTPVEIRLGKRVSEDPELLEQKELQQYRHYLERLKAEAPYRLTEEAERVIISKDVNGISLFSQLQSAWVSEKTFEVEVKGEKKTIPYPQLGALRMDPDRDTRKMATVTIYRCLADDKLLHSMALRSICGDHMSMVKARGMPSPMTQSLLDQDVDEEAINTLLSTIEKTSDSFREFLKLKAKVMGLDKLAGHDVIAPMTTDPVWNFDWEKARKTVIDSFTSFDSDIGGVVERMFTESRIDAANRVGKSYGAFCARHSGAKSSYVLLSFSETINDVYTLAHELGHAAQGHVTYNMQGPLNWRTSSCLAEMGSIFGELLLTDKLLSMSETKEEKMEILAHVLGGYFYTVYYVGLRALFERSIYDTIAEGKIIDAETACSLWNAAKERIFADSVDWTEFMEYEWARIPHHFIPNFRFYNYSYSFAQMLVFALYEAYKQEGPTFLERFRGLLGGGNTKSVRQHLKDFGYDLSDPAFWEMGAKQADKFLEEFKKLV
jgi:oligoendopeptidase F